MEEASRNLLSQYCGKSKVRIGFRSLNMIGTSLLLDNARKRGGLTPTDGVRAISGADLKDREQLIDQMISQLKSKNELIKETIHKQTELNEKVQENFNEDEAQNKLEVLSDEKKELEKELRAVENRIKHILTEKEEIEGEMANFDKKAKRILEARAKKIEWEKKRALELQHAKELELKKREQLAIKAVERDQIISQRKNHFSKHQEKVQTELKEEKKMSENLKRKIEEYEMVLREHKKLQGMSSVPLSKIDQLHRQTTEKKVKKEKIESKLKLESAAVSELDKKLERLRKFEEKMIEEKKASQSQKGHLISHLHDVMNKRMDETEIQDLLYSKETPYKSPTGMRRQSLERILSGEDIEKASRAKSPGLPTTFVGGNIGSHTEMRKKLHEQRERNINLNGESPLNQSLSFNKQIKALQGTRFSSPPARFPNPRPATAATKITGSTIKTQKNQETKPKTEVRKPAIQMKTREPPKLSKPSTSKPSVVTASKIGSVKAALKRETQKQPAPSGAQKTTLRGRGSKLEKEEPPTILAGLKDEVVEPILDSDVQIESLQKEEGEHQENTSPSENKFLNSNEDISHPEDVHQDTTNSALERNRL